MQQPDDAATLPGAAVSNSGAVGLLSPANRKLSVAIYTTIALIAFEGTSVAAALTELAADLGDVSRLPWVITAFLFALGLSTIIAGPLVDALGPRRLFVWSAAGFAGSGFAAGFANDIDVLIAIRLVQGSTAGVLFAATIAAINIGFPERLAGRAFAANSTIWGLMGAAAPAIAAVLLNVASWRWIFFVNLPLGALALLAGRNTMPVKQDGAEPASIDFRGAALAGVFTLATIAAVDRLGFQSIGFAALAVASVIVYLWHARRAERPIVNPEHFAVQPYRSLAIVPSLMLTASFATNIYITVYVAAGRGYANSTAAWTVIFFTVGWTIGANVSSFVLDRTTPVNVMTAGLATSTAGLFIVVFSVGPNLHLAVVFVGLFVLGVGIGLNTNASLTMLRARTPLNQIGRASAANQFARSQGFTLGAASGGAILLLVVGNRLGSLEPVRKLLAGEEIATLLSNDPQQAVRQGFWVVSAASLIVILLAIPAMMSLRRWAAREGPAQPPG